MSAPTREEIIDAVREYGAMKYNEACSDGAFQKAYAKQHGKDAAELLAEIEAMLRTLRDQREADARDAARYRWLSTQSQQGAVRTLLPLYRSHFVIVNESAHDFPQFDDAVNAAMSAQGEK